MPRILFLLLLLFPLPFGHCAEDNRKGKEGYKIELKVFMPQLCMCMCMCMCYVDVSVCLCVHHMCANPHCLFSFSFFFLGCLSSLSQLSVTESPLIVSPCVLGQLACRHSVLYASLGLLMETRASPLVLACHSGMETLPCCGTPVLLSLGKPVLLCVHLPCGEPRSESGWHFKAAGSQGMKRHGTSGKGTELELVPTDLVGLSARLRRHKSCD